MKAAHPDIVTSYSYVDAMALDMVRRPWDFDVMVMENMFGDILSDLAGGLVGGMGMAACAEIGDTTGLFQPAHGSAPDIAGTDAANPLAAILSAAMMLDYLADKTAHPAYGDAASLIEKAVEEGFAAGAFRPVEFGGDMGTTAVTRAVLDQIANPFLTRDNPMQPISVRWVRPVWLARDWDQPHRQAIVTGVAANQSSPARWQDHPTGCTARSGQPADHTIHPTQPRDRL